MEQTGYEKKKNLMTLQDILHKMDTYGYDQYGAFFGQVFITGSEQEQMELNLPGMRERRWNRVSESYPLERLLSIVALGYFIMEQCLR